MAELVAIGSDRLTAEINPLGAELTHLRDADGRELMTDADPAYWTGRAPLLFPNVGALAGDRYRLDGVDYPMPKHGFARRSTFGLVAAEAGHALFRLIDSAETRAVFPFAFALEMAFAIEGTALTMTASVTNRGDRDMPASFGLHPAFAWPVPYGRDRADHRIAFASDEPGALRRLDHDGLVLPTPRPSPLEDGRTLRLADALFEDDALIWGPVANRALRYGADEGPALEIAWDAPMLGIWTKPGAQFVCVEPWWGHADPQGFAGELWDKPGILRFAPGETKQFAMRVTLVA